MSAYVPTDWVDGVTPVDEARLDHLEAGVVAGHAGLPPSPVGQEGKWLRSIGGAMVWQTAPYIDQTLFDARGDMIVASAADTPARLALGTDGQLLTADAAAPNGVKWASPAASAGTWTAYTPSFLAATTNPTLGTGGTVTGRYCAIGKLIAVQVSIIFGSAGVSAGNGMYFISAPFPLGSMEWLGNGLLRDASTNNSSFPSIVKGSATQVNLYYPAAWPSGALTQVTQAAPWAWAANDQLNLWWIQETP